MAALGTTWLRRALVVPLYAVLLGMLVAALPLLLPIAALIDLLGRQPWILSRTLVFFVHYLLCELIGVAAALLLWLGSGVWAGADRRRFLDWNFALQRWWAWALGRGGFAIFDIRLRIDGDGYRHQARPLLVFIRHASTADTILAALLLAVPYGIRLRYVLKRELLWDPCLDIVGNRLPNVFVNRDSAHTDKEVAAVARLAEGLQPGEGVLIYPEGTRFSEAKKARTVARLRDEGRNEAAEQALALRSVLRPRSGGALALLDRVCREGGADVLFCAHTGFEASASFDRFFNGGLVGTTVHVRFWRVPCEEVPRGDQQRKDWLYRQWRRVDDFVTSGGGDSGRDSLDGRVGRVGQGRIDD